MKRSENAETRSHERQRDQDGRTDGRRAGTYEEAAQVIWELIAEVENTMPLVSFRRQEPGEEDEDDKDDSRAMSPEELQQRGERWRKLSARRERYGSTEVANAFDESVKKVMAAFEP